MDFSPPVILGFAPHDPAGRNGLQAIAEVIASLGGHCAGVVTALCTSSGSDEPDLMATDSNMVIQQARSVLEDMPVKAILVSYAGSVANLEAIHSILADYPKTPVITAAALQYWDNNSQAIADYPNAYAELLIPGSKLLICDNSYAPALTSNAPATEELIHRLFARSCEHLLTYQCSQASRSFEYTLYDEDTVLNSFNWQPGCFQPQTSAVEDIIAGAVSAYIAHGSSVLTATQKSLDFASQATAKARQIGFDSPIPNRFFWADPSKT
jgi:hydroxymethylpyrimidine/phosphomethylpyrimidine kinase